MLQESANRWDPRYFGQNHSFSRQTSKRSRSTRLYSFDSPFVSNYKVWRVLHFLYRRQICKNDTALSHPYRGKHV